MFVNSNLSTSGTNTYSLGSKSRFKLNAPDEELRNYQIQEFIKYIHNTKKSHNAYNKPEVLQSVLAGASIISQDSFCWMNGTRFIKGLALGRKCGDVAGVITMFETLFSYMGYLEQLPILVDRNWCIIDGYQRYLAAQKFDTMEIPYIMYDIDLKDRLQPRS